MAKQQNKTITQNDFNSLSLQDVLKLLEGYTAINKTELTGYKEKLISEDLQKHLAEAGVNSVCPGCHSKNICKNGPRNNVQTYKCTVCGRGFTLFSETIMEKTRYPWDVWVKVVEMTINAIPVEDMLQILRQDYNENSLTYRTVFNWKHKIIHALAQMPMPTLSGIIQIDETYFRESQKGARELQSTIKGETRKPRYGRRASKYGVMGNEFANVVCMTDLSGYCVAKVVGLGKLEIDTFIEMFDEYIEAPSYICSDANFTYRQYSEYKNVPLYVKPSNYLKTIQQAGYITPDWSDPVAAEQTVEANDKILAKLYYQKAIDYIYGREELTYKEFSELKNANSLSLARVNQFHNELKRSLVVNTKGVSTKYLPDYIGFQVFLRNWTISNGHFPSSLKDAEDILISILKKNIKYTAIDIKNSTLDLPKTSDKYMAMLKQNTKEMRQETKNPFFKFDEEDNVATFNKRFFLEELPKYKLDKLRKKYKIKKSWTRTAIIGELLKKSDIDKEIRALINDGKHKLIEDEDIEEQASNKFKT